MHSRWFWPLYALASMLSAGVSLYVFHFAVVTLDRPYEEGALAAGLLAMPINWLWGEQLTWTCPPASRPLRAARYFCACTVGLAIDGAAVHLFGHVLRIGARDSEALSILCGMLWTAPVNRYWVWAPLPRRLRFIHRS